MTLTPKEEKDFSAIKKRLAQLDMEKADLHKKLKANINFATIIVKERIEPMIDAYYSTPNPDYIYKINSGAVSVSSLSHALSVEFFITKFNRNGTSLASTYKVTTPTLPKDVDSWLNMGNRKLALAEAKDYIKASLTEEKKLLKARIKEIDNLIR